MARHAENALHEWAQTHLERLEVAVKRSHPRYLELFAGLQLAEPAAVLAVATLLARLDQKQAPGVLSTLATRGLSKTKRTQLQTWVDQAREAKPPAALVAPDEGATELDAANENLRDTPLVRRLVADRSNVHQPQGLVDTTGAATKTPPQR